MEALGETVKLQQQIIGLLSEGNGKGQASAESAAAPEDESEEVTVPMHADGVCEAVSRLDARDLVGCLTMIRASGHQVVIESFF